MSFTADWLALREPADQAARNHDLLMRAGRCVAAGKTVLDLGSGTGSTAQGLCNARVRWPALAVSGQ